MNPIWTQIIVGAVKSVTKNCTHCKKTATYPAKPIGQFYTCKHCGHRFKEKG
jgi:hypothetical protein